MAKAEIKGVTFITRKGVNYHYARIDGQRKYFGKGKKGYDLAVAAKAKSVLKKYENREMSAGIKTKKVHFKTIREMFNWYMELPSTQELGSYQRKINASVHILAFFGNRGIGDAEGDVQEKYRQTRLNGGAAHSTIDLEIIYLQTAYNTARKRRMIAIESIPGEFVRKKEVVPRRLVTDSEYSKLLKHADPDFKDFLICGYESAMRSGEVRTLTAGQVYLNVRHISGEIVDYIDLGIFDTKTGARRTVPVSSQLKEVLERRIKGKGSEDHVFTNAEMPFYNSLVIAKMKSTCKKAEVIYGDKPRNQKGERTGIVFHCLRHTRTSKWVEMGYSDEVIRRATGHKSLEAYQRYIKLDPAVVMRLVKGNPKRYKNGIKNAGNL